MTKLTDQQRELLTRAAEAEGVDAATEMKTIASGLIKRGLMISVPRPGGPSRLLITTEGRIAVGARPAETSIPSTIPQAEPPPPKRGGKISTLVDLLKRPEGATIAAMVEATGWQAHSVRGAMSGAIGKTLGLKVTSEKAEAGRIYRITDEARA